MTFRLKVPTARATQAAPTFPAPAPPPNLRAPRRPSASLHPRAYDTIQEAVDITSDHHRPITDILTRARSTIRPARSNDYLHVSDLLFRCIRAIGLQEQLGRPAPAQQLRLADRLTFRQGEAIAEIIMSAVQETSPAALWGDWTCRCRRTKTQEPCTYAAVTSHPVCVHCLTALDEYVEVPMFNEEYKIVGNPDLLLFLEQYNCFHITELKSITPNEFPDLARAKPEHVLQSVFYWWLMQQAGYRLTTHVSIVYINKGHTFRGEQYREFTIDAASQIARLDMFLQEALALKLHRAGEAPVPPRTRCNTPDDSFAKKCHVCQACFSSAQGAPHRRSVDLASLAASREDTPEVATPRSAPGRAAAPTGPSRPSRIPGAPPIPLGDRSIPTVNRIRVPAPRRR